MDVLDVVLVVLGGLLVLVTLLDAFDTLLATHLAGLSWSLSGTYYAMTWRPYRSLCARIDDDHRREQALGLFGPASFIGLLLVWTTASIAGWGLIWWGVRGQFSVPPDSVGDAFYYAGVAYFSIGFGDILPGSTLTKALSILAAMDGLGTLGLVIGYLPTLSAAYKERESQLLLLDDLTDARITPVSLILSRLGPDGDATELDAMFRDWERWCADVFESHSSLPMLVLWRSKHRGHSWITALGVVTDAAIDHIAITPGAEKGPAMRLYRQSVRLVRYLSDRLGLSPQPYSKPGPEAWTAAHALLVEKGVAGRSAEESFALLHDLREPFHPAMEAFIEVLLAPRGFWGVTAAQHLAEPDLDSLFRDIEPRHPEPD
ncbi:MAG TPA: potassium channel family protein [Iamia sp.]|nr:potassium channel family protein [Iamia sp.]